MAEKRVEVYVYLIYFKGGRHFGEQQAESTAKTAAASAAVAERRPLHTSAAAFPAKNCVGQ
jgi:hypothetical protein